VRERRLIEKDLVGLADLPIGDITAPALLAAPAVLIGIRPKILPGALEQQAKHFASVTDPALIGDPLCALWGAQTPSTEFFRS